MSSSQVINIAMKLKFKFIQKFKNLAKKETGLQVARAILGGPDLQLFKDKINIITVITINVQSWIAVNGRQHLCQKA